MTEKKMTSLVERTQEQDEFEAMFQGEKTTYQTATRQYVTHHRAKCNAWQIAQAVARWMHDHGHLARACQGPAQTSPDDERGVHCAHVQAPAEAWEAFRARPKH